MNVVEKNKGPVCTICGKEMDMWDISNNINIHKSITYGSIYDGQRLDIDLCCNCLDMVIKKIATDFILWHRLVHQHSADEAVND